MRLKPDLEVIGNSFYYSIVSGRLYWARNAGSRALAGSEAGHLASNGYRVVRVCGRRLLVHRIAAFLVTGEWPGELDVDHENGLPSCNGWHNLRVCSAQENMQNRRGPIATSKSGFLGVSWSRSSRKWRAQIGLGAHKRCLHIGYFDRAEDAAAAYLKVKRELHAGCSI